MALTFVRLIGQPDNNVQVWSIDTKPSRTAKTCIPNREPMTSDRIAPVCRIWLGESIKRSTASQELESMNGGRPAGFPRIWVEEGGRVPNKHLSPLGHTQTGAARFVSSRSERLGSISRSRCERLQEWTDAVASLSCGLGEESRASKQSLGETAGSVVSELDIAAAFSTK